MREKSQRWLQGLWPEQLTRMEFPFIEMRKAVGNSKLQDWKVVIQLWTCYELDVSYICGSVEWAVAYVSLELRGKVLTGGYKCGRHKNLDIIWKPWACHACIHPLPIYSAGSQATQPIAQVTSVSSASFHTGQRWDSKHGWLIPLRPNPFPPQLTPSSGLHPSSEPQFLHPRNEAKKNSFFWGLWVTWGKGWGNWRWRDYFLTHQISKGF